MILFFQVGLQFQVLEAKSDPREREITCRLFGLKPYTNYTVWFRSIGASGDVSPSTHPINFITDPERECKISVVQIPFLLTLLIHHETSYLKFLSDVCSPVYPKIIENGYLK